MAVRRALERLWMPRRPSRRLPCSWAPWRASAARRRAAGRGSNSRTRPRPRCTANQPGPCRHSCPRRRGRPSSTRSRPTAWRSRRRGGRRSVAGPSWRLARRLGSGDARRTGYTVHDFGDAAQALRFVRHFERKIDLLLLDITLPDVNGKELQRIILESHPDARTLFLTGNSPLMIKNLGMDSEGEPVLRKPFTIYDLSKRVREVLDQPATRS